MEDGDTLLERDAMSSLHKQYVMPKDGQGDFPGVVPAEPFNVVQSLAAPVRQAIHQTRLWLLDQQAADGSWCAELEGDTILESETILLLAFLGHEDTDGRRAAGRISGREAIARGRLGTCIPAGRSRSAAA